MAGLVPDSVLATGDAAFVLGACGDWLLVPAAAAWLPPLGTLYVNLIMMIATPLVFLLVDAAAKSHGPTLILAAGRYAGPCATPVVARRRERFGSARTRLPAGLAALILAGCASLPAQTAPRGEVGVREVDTAVAPASRLSLGANESFQRPLFASDNALPDYPALLLAQRLPPQPVCLRVGISAEGSVVVSEPVHAGVDCAATARAAPGFVAAARAATRQWRFDPAFRCVYPEGLRPEHGMCVGKGVKEVPQAVSLVYRFVFEQVDGRGRVRMED
jgi:hypothetical protein